MSAAAVGLGLFAARWPVVIQFASPAGRPQIVLPVGPGVDALAGRQPGLVVAERMCCRVPVAFLLSARWEAELSCLQMMATLRADFRALGATLTAVDERGAIGPGTRGLARAGERCGVGGGLEFGVGRRDERLPCPFSTYESMRRN